MTRLLACAALARAALARAVLARAALALAAAATVVAGVAAPATAATHSGPSWTWSGPTAWTATYGTYGITVTGVSGAVLDLGFSSTTCARGATWGQSVNAYFAARRSQLRSNGWTFTAQKIANPAGFSTTYRRQVLRNASYAAAGRTGEIVIDYDFTQSVGGVDYCYQKSLAMYAEDSAWPSKRTVLTGVRDSLVYSGPGAPPGQDPGQF